jgi:hypothetical protein
VSRRSTSGRLGLLIRCLVLHVNYNMSMCYVACRFWEACVRLKYAPVREISERMRAIYVQFLAPGAAEAVNVDSKIQETVNKKLSVLYSDRYVFEEAEVSTVPEEIGMGNGSEANAVST